MTSLFKRNIFLLTLLLLVPQSVFAASLRFVPTNATVAAGDRVSVSVVVSSSDQALNAVSGVVSFPNDLLHVSSLSKSGSVLSLWVQEPSFSNADGTVNFTGAVPNPGYTGVGARVLTITFTAQKKGTAVLTFSSPQVLANDGNGTNILSGAEPTSIFITEAKAPVAPVEVPVATTSAPTPAPAVVCPLPPPVDNLPLYIIAGLLAFIVLLLIIIIWLEVSARHRPPVTTRVKRVLDQVDARLEKLRTQEDGRLGMISQVAAKDIVAKESALKAESYSIIKDAEKDVARIVSTLGDIPETPQNGEPK